MSKDICALCSRCGRRFQELGIVLSYGKFYPAHTYNKLVESGSEQEAKYIRKGAIPPVYEKVEVGETREIKKALCVECSKEVF